MFIQEISIEIKTDHDREDALGQFRLLLRHLLGNGQMIESCFSYFQGDVIKSNIEILEPDALHPSFHSIYVAKQWAKLEELSGSRIQVTDLGITHTAHETGCCTCSERTFGLLYTNFISSAASEVLCGNCRLTIPLYRLELDDRLRDDLLGWGRDYRHCDGLQMGCRVGERWAMRQMMDVNSALNTSGRKVGEALAVKMGVPIYYYLFNYKAIKPEKDRLRKCPSCGGDWLLKERIGMYDFKCDRCYLLSSFSPNTA